MDIKDSFDYNQIRNIKRNKFKFLDKKIDNLKDNEILEINNTYDNDIQNLRKHITVYKNIFKWNGIYTFIMNKKLYISK